MSALSHPSRGAWIEIVSTRSAGRSRLSHPSRGAWIEILFHKFKSTTKSGRTPRGVRGLK